MLSGQHQLFAILAIISETAGKSRQKGTAAPQWSRPLSHAAIAKKTGSTKDRVAFDLADAERRGLIASLTPEQAAKRGLKTDGSSPQAKRYRVLPENWATAEPYQAPKIAIVRTPAPVEVDDGDEFDDDDQVATASALSRSDRAERAGPAPAPPRHVTMTIKPGQQVRPKLGPATDYRVQALCSFPVEIDARNERGVINFLIRDGAAGSRKPDFAPGAFALFESESNQRVTEGTDERSFVGQKSNPRDRRARLIEGLAARRLPVTPKFAVSLEGKLGTCDLDFFLRELDSRLKRSTKITAALLPGFIDETVAKWRAMEPVNRKLRDQVEECERRAAEIERQREAYWDSAEGRKRLAEMERDLADDPKRPRY